MGRRALSGLASAVAAILLAPVGAQAATDLHPLLADPPGSDWSSVAAAADVLVGDFTARSYADYLKADRASPNATEFALDLYGFTRGYALEWKQQRSNDLLIERVFEFRDKVGARSWYTLLKRSDKTAPEFTGDISVPPSIPTSTGSSFRWSDGQIESSVKFSKGNLVFVVDMGSYANDLSEPTVAQAVGEYAHAPLQTQVPPGAGQAVNEWLRNIGIAAGAAVVAVAIVITITIVLVTRRRRPAALLATGPAMPASGPTTSADGAYWWDGQRWRDASVEAPATAPRSPDGAHWWDGRAWRPVPAPPPPG